MTALVSGTFTYHKIGDWQWVENHIGYFWSLSQTHLYMALVSVLIGFAVALPLGLLAVRLRRTYGPILAITTVLYALPSIATITLLLPVTGLTENTVIIPLATYAVAILVRSVTDGLNNVTDEVRTAATAMGYGPFRRVLAVELPASIPVLIAGLRLATVASISLVTVGSLVGIGGLGQLFIAGENADFVTEIVAGIVIVAFWALVLDGLLLVSGRLLAPWARRTP